MRIQKINKYRLDIAEDSTEISVDIKPCEYIDNLGLFDDPKEFKKYVMRLKYYIRNTMEYKNLMKFLKFHRGMGVCGIHNNISVYDGFSIEIHHTPFVMEDIIYIVIKKRIERKDSLKMSAIAEEIMELHYLGLIGLYPLCTTCHEYAHGDANDLFIPLNDVYGDPAAFYDIYKEYVSEPLQNKFNNILQLNEGYRTIESNVPQGLIKKYIYITQENGDSVISTKKLYNFINELNQK